MAIRCPEGFGWVKVRPSDEKFQHSDEETNGDAAAGGGPDNHAKSMMAAGWSRPDSLPGNKRFGPSKSAVEGGRPDRE